MTAFRSNDPFAVPGKPFVNSPPGVNPRSGPDALRLPSPPHSSARVSSPKARLAAALVRLSSSRGGEKFLP